MTVNQDGTVTITNNQTGEQKTVLPDQLSGYSPLLMNQYIAYMTARKVLDKTGTGNGATDTLTPPDNSVIKGGGATTSGGSNTSNTPANGNDLLNKTMTPAKKLQQQMQNGFNSGMAALAPNMTSLTPSNNTPGYTTSGNNTLYYTPQVQQQKPQDQGLSTFKLPDNIGY